MATTMEWEITKIKQKLSEGYVIIKIDRHEARKTSAYTKWQATDTVYNIYDTYANNKTHWEEFWLVKPDVTLFRIRKSNRGNINVDRYIAKDLKLSQEEVDRLIAIIENN